MKGVSAFVANRSTVMAWLVSLSIKGSAGQKDVCFFDCPTMKKLFAWSMCNIFFHFVDYPASSVCCSFKFLPKQQSSLKIRSGMEDGMFTGGLLWAKDMLMMHDKF